MNTTGYLTLFGVVTATSVYADTVDLSSISLEDLLQLEINLASGFSEKLLEVPTPISIITQEMIKQSGVYTIRDLLTLYVPSFTQVQDHNEYNVSFRGIYTSSQQKFLIMLNGHRLNSRAYSMANPDHAIALEKVERIEVLRGPGSSVYGNIALTNVVNIISKSGADVAGFNVSFELGNHGYKEVYLEYGHQKAALEYFSWFKFVESDGEPHSIKPQDDYSANPKEISVTSYLDGFFNKPSYDFGLIANFEEQLTLLINYRQGHYVEPLTTGGSSGEAYDLDDFPLVDGVNPGTISKWWHVYLKKSWQLDAGNSINLKAYYDTNDIAGPVTTNAQTSAFLDVSWKEYDYGINAQWQHDFDTQVLLLGIDYEDTKVFESQALAGAHGEIIGPILFDGDPVLRLGSESMLSGYLQIKKYLDDYWLLNTGIRYDEKNRLTGKNISEISPRIALIYHSEDSFYKLSYSKSFVDPPYWNRYSRFATFRGSSDLKPEILESIQFTPEFFFFDKKLQLKFNLYFNEYTDVVFRQITAQASDPLFINAGLLKTTGLEQELAYQFGNKSFRLIGSHYKIRQVKGYSSDNNEIFNIPRNQYNLIFDHQYSDALSYQVSLKYIGSRKSPINIALNGEPVEDPFPDQGVEFQVPDNHLSASYLVNTNVRWQLAHRPIMLTFNIQNLFDKAWYQGGSVAHPYRQTGRWFKLGLEYKF